MANTAHCATTGLASGGEIFLINLTTDQKDDEVTIAQVTASYQNIHPIAIEEPFDVDKTLESLQLAAKHFKVSSGGYSVFVICHGDSSGRHVISFVGLLFSRLIFRHRMARSAKEAAIEYRGKPLTKTIFQDLLEETISQKIGIHFAACCGAELLQSSDHTRKSAVSGAGFGATFVTDFIKDITHIASPPASFHSQSFDPPFN
jgi:hypothetical protein